MRIFQLFLSNNSIILLPILFFFFLLRTISHQIISNYKGTQQTRPVFIPAKKHFRIHSSKKQSLLQPFSSILHGPPCVWERENGFCPWTGRGRVIVRIFRQVCVARGLCVEKILTVGAVLFAPSKKRERGDIDSKEIVECFSNLSLPWPGPHSLTVNCV